MLIILRALIFSPFASHSKEQQTIMSLAALQPRPFVCDNTAALHN